MVNTDMLLEAPIALAGRLTVLLAEHSLTTPSVGLLGAPDHLHHPPLDQDALLVDHHEGAELGALGRRLQVQRAGDQLHERQQARSPTNALRELTYARSARCCASGPRRSLWKLSKRQETTQPCTSSRG
jgi:hypothetical protein